MAGDIGEVFQSGDMSGWFRNNSYAEWYANTLKFEDSPTREWHNRHYGAGFHYDDFALPALTPRSSIGSRTRWRRSSPRSTPAT